MNYLNHDLHCFKPSPVGGIGYDLVLSKSEIAMLQLLLSSREDAFEYWRLFWMEVSDYEMAPFGCKELMPLAVRKMQKTVAASDWQSVVPLHASFLSGLPKYAWSKNKFILAECYKLADQLHQMGIEVMAIKGVAEMMRIPEIMLMRTSRDIDLLIRPRDIEESVKFFQSQGWYSNQVVNGVPRHLSDFDGNSFTFDHPNYPVSLDIHFDVVSDGRGQFSDFTSELWLNKKSAPCNHPIYIPSAEDRFCLFLANAFVPDNWTSGLVNKYLYDLLFQIQGMSDDERAVAQVKATKFLNLGNAIEQITILNKKIVNPQHSQHALALTKFNLINRLKRGIRVKEERYYYFWHLYNYYQSRFPEIKKRYGFSLSYTYLFLHFFFNTRPVQVVYWRSITIKDQVIERVQYYIRRAIFHGRKRILNASFVFKGPSETQKNQDLHIEQIASTEYRNDEKSVETTPVNLVTQPPLTTDQGNRLPGGVMQSFYLSTKLFKF